MSDSNNETAQVYNPYLYHAGDDEEVPTNVEDVTVHDSVVDIPGNAFLHLDKLLRVTMLEGLKTIDNYAFLGCHHLTSVSFPPSLESIGNEVFGGCVSLKEVKLPSLLKTINVYAFSDCTSLVILNLPPLLKEICDGVFQGCTSLIAVHFPNSLEYIGEDAFKGCYSLISAKLPLTVHVQESAFYDCFTLELARFNYPGRFQFVVNLPKSVQSAIFLKYRQLAFALLPMHSICSDINITLDQIHSIKWHNNSDIEDTYTYRDQLGLTGLHFLCLNPEATPEMFKIITNAYPQAATMQSEIITDDLRREMVTPLKLFLKMKLISYDDSDFNDEGCLTLDKALQKGLEWHDLLTIMYIQSYDLGKQNDESRLYPFMQVGAASVNGMNLETIYHLAMYDIKVIHQ
mmetsp:Transcript_9901/g.12545  ORF Transcript_9901/g.12545 Transcript_9901/m.12545 type:complete len:402 (+) Transcript_9901:121-1326(+)